MSDPDAEHRQQGPYGTEEQIVASINGRVIRFASPVRHKHVASDDGRCEVANLSRNVVIESADPSGPARGHTMYHRNSSGGISYAEFRHLGKQGVLGKYPIHFHLVRDAMRGAASSARASGIRATASWRSTAPTTCSSATASATSCVGHGFFLEDATEQYNVLDRNLAVQALEGKPLPEQALPFDHNEGAGFWWANGRNTFTRNVACENDRYGFRFDINKINDEAAGRGPARCPTARVGPSTPAPSPSSASRTTRATREGLYSFDFGDDPDRRRFTATRAPVHHPQPSRLEDPLRPAPSVSYYLGEHLDSSTASTASTTPDYDATSTATSRLNRVQLGADQPRPRRRELPVRLVHLRRPALENCRTGRDPMIQLTCTSPRRAEPGTSAT